MPEQTRPPYAGTTDTFFTLNERWHFTHLSPETAAFFSRPEAHLSGQPIWAALPELVGTPFEAELRRAAADNQPASFEAAYPNTSRRVEVRAYPFAGGLSVFARDVTERNRVERALAESEERFARFGESQEALRLLGLLVDASGRLTRSLDPHAVRTAVLDLSHRLIAADAHAIWRLIPEEDRWVLADAAGLSEAYSHANLPAGGLPIPEEPIVAEDVQGSSALESRRLAYRDEGIVSLIAVPLRVHGRVTGTLVFYYRTRHRFDAVTVRVATALADLAGAAIGTAELFQRESELRRRAEDADRSKDSFLALLGHELRNPLAPIRNAVEILRLQGNDPAVVGRARDMISRQAVQMTRLVDDLLDASRITQGKVQLTLGRVDLAGLARMTAEDRRAGVEAAGLVLAVELPDRPVRVRADAARLAQVIGNLIHNSQKFTDPGGRVTVRVGEAGGEAVLTVADTGVGIAPEVLGQLFRAFHQVEGNRFRSEGGLGLGLAVVKGLVELHGGRVEAASDGVGHGTTFTVRLPLDAAAG